MKLTLIKMEFSENNINITGVNLNINKTLLKVLIILMISLFVKP